MARLREEERHFPSVDAPKSRSKRLSRVEELSQEIERLRNFNESIIQSISSGLILVDNHGEIIYTKDFGYFIQEMDLRMYVCRTADPESKGKIENLIGYLKKNFLSVRDFEELKEAQESLRKWIKRRANGKISQATKRIPSDVIEEERKQLRPLRSSIYRKDSLIGREARKADEYALISVGASKYSVPAEYKKRSVEIYTTDSQLFVFDRHTGVQIAEHELSLIPGSKNNKRGQVWWTWPLYTPLLPIPCHSHTRQARLRLSP